MWKHLERIAPAGLPTYRSGDLLARLVADVDAQQDLFLRVALQYAAAGVAGAGAVALLWWLLSAAGVAPAVALLLATAAVPWLAARIGRRAEQRVAPLRGELSDGIAELLRGAPDLLACGAAGRRLDRVAGIDRALRRALAGTATAAGLAAGRVTLNGVDIRALAGDDVRRVLGLCAQDAHVFDTSVGENVLLARRSAGPGEVRAALAGARLLDWVDGLPDGTATAVGEHGSRVSGGERQRLALARTLLADRPVLLLDEPTEHLDLATADPLAADLVCAAAGRTTLLVTHRLATLAEVDEIVVLDAGQVVERGTHAGLLAARGPYRRMWDLERDAGRFSDPVAVPGGGGGTSAQAQVRSPLRSWARSR